MKLSFRKPKLLPLLITLVAVVTCASLGVWQLQRMDWKQGLKDRIAERVGSEAIAVPSVIDTPIDWEYQPVTVTGTFDHSKESYQ